MLLLAAWPVLPAWLSQTCLGAGDTALPPFHTAPSLQIPKTKHEGAPTCCCYLSKLHNDPSPGYLRPLVRLVMGSQAKHVL